MRRLDAATTAAMNKWNEVEPEKEITASYVASWVDATREALKVSDELVVEKIKEQITHYQETREKDYQAGRDIVVVSAIISGLSIAKNIVLGIENFEQDV